MEEKERFSIGIINGILYLYDNFNKYNTEITLKDLSDLLNQQDKRIKELEATNKVLSNELTKNNIMKQDRLETCCGIPIYEIPTLKQENQQLQQSQKQLAINELKKLSKHFFYSGDEMVSDYDLDCYPSELKEEIERRIRSLKRRR